MICESAEKTLKAGEQLGKTLSSGDVVALSGPLGAGKTVFARGIAESIGIQEPVTSPTYTLISEYEGRMPLYHMDLYRLGSPEEFTWLGVEEILNGSGITLIEWSERAGEELPERTITVNIEIADNGNRIITISNSREVAA